MSLTAIKLTDAANTISADTGQPLASCQIEYPTCSPFSENNRWLLVLEVSYFALYDVATRTRIRPMIEVDASSEPRWSRHDPNLFYFHKANRLCSYDVETQNIEIIHTFTEYESISAKGESEISEDGESLVLIGDNKEVLIYRIGQNYNRGAVIGVNGQLDSVGFTPDGNVIVAGAYLELFDRQLNRLRTLTWANGHRHVARDAAGKEWLIWDNSNEHSPRTFEQHAIVKIDLEIGEQTKLMDLSWAVATHITASMGPMGWCIVGTYDPSKPGADGLFKVWLDGRTPELLLSHGSNSATYEGQPRASVSRDGRWLAYNSNVAGRTDVYLAELGQTQPEPTSLVWKRFPNQAALTPDNFPAQPGEGGTVYDGGDDVKIILNDGTHKWFIPMKLIQ